MKENFKKLAALVNAIKQLDEKDQNEDQKAMLSALENKDISALNNLLDDPDIIENIDLGKICASIGLDPKSWDLKEIRMEQDSNGAMADDAVAMAKAIDSPVERIILDDIGEWDSQNNKGPKI